MPTAPSARRPRANRNTPKTPPADTQTPLAKSSARNAAKASKAIKAALAETPEPMTTEQSDAVLATAPGEPVPDSSPIPDLFRKNKTIAQIAVNQKTTIEAVRAALAAAGVDYSKDKSANAEPAKPKTAWTLSASFDAIFAKTIDPKSKRGQVVADLGSAQLDDLKSIVQNMATADAATLPIMANALNAALSAHYARV